MPFKTKLTALPLELLPSILYGVGEPLQSVIVSGNYFDLLGVRPHRGRLFRAGEDDMPGAVPTAVLSYASWQRRFAGETDVIGRTIHLNGVPVLVVGVAQRGFAGVDLGEPEAWLPMGAAQLEAFGGDRQFTNRVYWLQMIGRRRPLVGLRGVEYVASGAAGDPYAAPGPVPLRVQPLRTMFFADQQGANPVPPWAIGITIAVLLLACATVANLVVAQNSVREREFAIRLALGEPRERMIRQLLLENLMVALAAAVCATLLAFWTGGLLRVLPIPVIPQLVDPGVAVFAFAVAIVTTAVYGLLPALRASRVNLDTVLRRGSHASAPASRLQQGLMVGQIAISFMLLTGAGLFVSSFRNAQQIDVGFDLQQVLTVAVPLGAATPAEARMAVSQAAVRVAHLPGVESVGAANVVPYYFFSRGSFTIPDGRDEQHQRQSLLVNAVAGDYFNTLGIPITAGRAFDDRHVAGTAPVAVISESLARSYWPTGNALGRCIRLTIPHGDQCVLIVGIAGDVRFQEIRGESSHILYLAAGQDPRGYTPSVLFVRTRGSPSDMITAVRSAVQEGVTGMPYVEVQALEARARPQRVSWEVAASLFTVFGAIAALLAAVGLYMLVTFIVAQRTREIGVHLALGATRGAVVRMVLRRGVRLTAAGIAVGAVGALAVGRVLAHQLYGISPGDPTTYLLVSLLLGAVALVASAAPARTAAGTEPMRILQD